MQALVVLQILDIEIDLRSILKIEDLCHFYVVLQIIMREGARGSFPIFLISTRIQIVGVIILPSRMNLFTAV